MLPVWYEFTSSRLCGQAVFILSVLWLRRWKFCLFNFVTNSESCLESYAFGWLSCTDIETNECLENNGGCWHDRSSNITACMVFLSLNFLRHIFAKRFVSTFFISHGLVYLDLTIYVFLIIGYLPRKSLWMPYCSRREVCWWRI